MKRTGQSAVLFALSLTALVGFAALAIDVSAARVSRHQLGNAAEAASHAGAAQLDGSIEGMNAARVAALTVAAENRVENTSVLLDANEGNASDGDVVLGYWSAGAFISSTEPSVVTTVRVLAERDDLRSTFAKLAFGADTLSAGDYSIAEAGGPAESPCPLPISLADCEIAAVSESCDLNVVLNSDRLDNGAWARKGGSQANAAYIADALDPDVCAAQSETGEILTLNNGSVASGLQRLATAVNNSPDTWDATTMGTQPAAFAQSSIDPYGHVLYGQIMVFHDPGNCASTKYNGDRAILGYATAVVYDVVATGGSKSLRMRIACDEAPAKGGGAYFGTTVPPRFVR
ncbi:MAG: pilus assembly protein TadG-related protein [Pseudomonadota bacterium]|nr:pilus assembly protein TadG-related protein [Pseudomonadota bacterium]